MYFLTILASLSAAGVKTKALTVSHEPPRFRCVTAV